MLYSVTRILRTMGATPLPTLHVGAHHAEERSAYVANGFRPRLWVEANPVLAHELKTQLDSEEDVVFWGAATDSCERSVDLNLASNSEASSLLELGTHKTHYPDIQFVDKVQVPVIHLGDILRDRQESWWFINLDIQGGELSAIRSLGEELSRVQVIYTEVSKEPLYLMSETLGEMDRFLESKQFYRVATRMTGSGWGDAVYLRTERKIGLLLTSLNYFLDIPYNSVAKLRALIIRLVTIFRKAKLP